MSFIWDLIPNMQADNYSILVAQQIYIYLSIILKLVNKECLLTGCVEVQQWCCVVETETIKNCRNY